MAPIPEKVKPSPNKLIDFSNLNTNTFWGLTFSQYFDEQNAFLCELIPIIWNDLVILIIQL